MAPRVPLPWGRLPKVHKLVWLDMDVWDYVCLLTLHIIKLSVDLILKLQDNDAKYKVYFDRLCSSVKQFNKCQ